MYNLHLFFLRYKWYERFAYNRSSIELAEWISIIVDIFAIFWINSDVLKFGMLLISSLLSVYFVFLKLNMFDNERKKEKSILYVELIIWNLFCLLCVASLLLSLVMI